MHKSTSISIDWPTNNLPNNLRPTDKSVYGVSMFKKRNDNKDVFFDLFHNIIYKFLQHII